MNNPLSIRSCCSCLFTILGALSAFVLCPSPVAADCAPVPAGLVSWWQGEDNANDAVGGNNGALNGAGFAPGLVGQAFSFDGNHSIVVSDSASLRFTNALTFEAWINPRSVGGNFHEIVSKWESVNGNQYSYAIA